MLASVLTYINDVITREGDFVDHPSDRGGPTRWGITERVARAFGYEGEMKDLPRELAADIYLQRYWTEPKFDRVAMISPIIAEEMFDTGINMGPSTAVKFLQRSLNVLNLQGKKFPDMRVDGYLGTLSLDALRTFLAHRGIDGERTLFKMLNGLQSVRYIELAEKSPSQEDFEYGWQRSRVS